MVAPSAQWWFFLFSHCLVASVLRTTERGFRVLVQKSELSECKGFGVELENALIML